VEWIDALEGKVVGLDTTPLIYLIEEHPVYLPLVRPFFEAADRGRLSFVTSVVTLVVPGIRVLVLDELIGS
jgi:hypothetical protein